MKLFWSLVCSVMEKFLYEVAEKKRVTNTIAINISLPSRGEMIFNHGTN